tara:strand:+ start:5944 stop:6855 length:912 start_codon:yes stop_codon:yes gene_type:complete
MLRFEWNSARLRDEDYVRLLNTAFDGNWSLPAFHWYFTRKFAGRVPDVVVAFDGDDPVSGGCLNYRRLRAPGGDIVEVAVVTAAWTSASARGKGYYTAVMREVARFAAANDCPLLLGFVLADNPSAAGMKTAGAILVPTAYLVSHTGASAASFPRHDVETIALPATEMYRLAERQADATIFDYPGVADWQSQFMQRLDPVEVLKVGDAGYALVERSEQSDRLQLLIAGDAQRAAVVASIAARSAQRGREFFMFGTGDWTRRCGDAANLEIRPGFITCLPTNGLTGNIEALIRSPWDLHSGDRM